MDEAKGFRIGIRAKTVAIFMLFTVAVSVLLTVSIYAVVQGQLLEQLKSKLLASVELGADSIDAGELASLVSLVGETPEGGDAKAVENSDAFRSISDQLNKIRGTDPQSIRYIYTFIPTDDPDTARFIVDADVLDLVAGQKSGTVGQDEEISHFGSDFDVSEFEVAREAVRQGVPLLDKEYVWDEDYKVNSISGYAPVTDGDGKVVAILGIDMADIDARNTLSRVTLLSAIIAASVLVIALLISLVAGALMTRDIISLRKTVEKFGEQDFTARATVKSRDEIGSLGRSFNEMAQTIVDYQDRILLVERAKAEAELTSRIESARSAENGKYLENISQGLLLMDENRVISGQYSRFLTELFKLSQSPAGLDFIDFVYPDKDAHVGERRELEGFLDILKNNTTADADMIDAINPFKDRELVVHDGSVIVADAHFIRVGKGDRVESLMVVFEDKTSLREAERRLTEDRARYDAELESIAAILKNGPALFNDFLRDGEALIDEFSLQPAGGIDPAQKAHFMRQFHSLKGSARSLQLPKIAKEAHQVEDILSADGDCSTESERCVLRESVDLIKADIENLRILIESFQAFGGSGTVVSPRRDLDSFVNSLSSMAEDLARQLQKQVQFIPRIEVEELPYLRDLKNPIIHLIRNSLDHGIEDIYERVAAGKDQTGKIFLDVRKEGAKILVTVSDDGRGIDLEAVKRSAIKKGMLAEGAKTTEKQLMKFLFEPSFSSKETVTDISGRGVGLDAVAQTVKKLNGKLHLTFKKAGGSSFEMSIPLKRASDFA